MIIQLSTQLRLNGQQHSRQLEFQSTVIWMSSKINVISLGKRARFKINHAIC